MSILKYLTIPHVSTFDRRWVRRIVIIAAVPQEVIRVVYGVFVGAAMWWNEPFGLRG